MFSLGTIPYLVQATETSQRKLVAGALLDQTGEQFRAEFTCLSPAISPETAVSFLFERYGRLFQRGARVISRTNAEPPSEKAILEFEFVGEEVSADSRSTFRVSTASLELVARFENERACRMLDISSEGIAIVIGKELRIGTLGRLRFEFGEFAIDCRARVQSMKQRGDDFRCGLHIPASETVQRSSLQKLTSLLQREQLQQLRQSA